MIFTFKTLKDSDRDHMQELSGILETKILNDGTGVDLKMIKTKNFKTFDVCED